MAEWRYVLIILNRGPILDRDEWSAALPLWNLPPVPTVYEDGLAPEPV